MAKHSACHTPRKIVQVRFGLTALVCLLSACSRETHTAVESGQFCMYADQQSVGTPNEPGEEIQDLMANQPWVGEMFFNECLSSSCDDLESASCEVRVAGQTLIVSARAEIVSKGTDCTSDCGWITASCTVPPLAPGHYVVDFAGNQTTLDVPSKVAPVCVDSGKSR